MKKPIFFLPLILLITITVNISFGQQKKALLLLRYPTMSKNKIVFEYGNELWEVPRSGGRAHILAKGAYLPNKMAAGQNTIKPVFSPNGKQLAFTGTYDHNTDVYVMPAEGGQPERITWHPYPDIVVGWSPDSKNILFRSHRYSFNDPGQLFTVPESGGFPQRLPLSMAEAGSYSPDGSHIAYVPNFQWEPFWKGYKGGQHTQIWISRLSDSHTIRIPDMNANESDPMWVGNSIYFLSDRDGANTLFRYDVKTKKVKKLIENDGFDITSASAGPGGIVYSQFGRLYILNFNTGKPSPVPVIVKGDLPQRHPYFQNVAKQLINPDISPNGKRVLFQAHGDILSLPVKEGSEINLTQSPGAMDREPVYAPNGKSIAYFSDKDGEYDLYISPQNGGKAKKIALKQDDAYYYDLTWSPDSKKLLFADQKSQLWYVNIEKTQPAPIKIATNNISSGFVNNGFAPSWSPDSRWITFTETLPNYFNGIYIYSLKENNAHQITKGASDCFSPVFDTNGKYLYFLASTNSGSSIGSDLSVLEHPIVCRLYAVTLKDSTKSPLALKSGLETPSPEEKKSAKSKKSKGEASQKDTSKIDIDFNNITRRIIALPVKPAFYMGLFTGKSGVIYLEKGPLVILPMNLTPSGTLPFSVEMFTLKNKKTIPIQGGLSQFILSSNENKMLFKNAKGWFVSAPAPKSKPVELKIKNLHVQVAPQKQWAEMYHEAWRLQRAFFYSPNYHGLDIDKAEKEFAHYLPGIASRNGLTFLFREMLSYLSIGHMYIYNGYMPKMEDIKVGLLGANYKIENNRYRIAKILSADQWSPGQYAPLAQPGLKVKKGDYILAINGKPLLGSQNIYKTFNDLAGKTVQLTVGSDVSGKDAHILTVKTIPSEKNLRKKAWIKHNIERVNQLSDGKLAYIYLPDTQWGGLTNFNRYFFSQIDKKGVIIDERFNHGGLLSDYIIRHLLQKPRSLIVTRWGKRKTALTPASIRGPKVMVINQFSGSGGDALPWYFKKAKVGKLVGVRTWGGLVGIGGYPLLMDGGTVTAPRTAVEALDGTFPVENHGIAPDVKVWQDPEQVRQGKDPQLDAAVKLALKELKLNPPKKYKKAPWFDYHLKLPPLPAKH